MAETLPRCRVYLVLPADASAAIERSLAEVLEATEVACVLRSAGATETDPDVDARLCALARILGSASSPKLCGSGRRADPVTRSGGAGCARARKPTSIKR